MWCWWTNTWWGCRILWTWPTDLCLTSKDCLKHMLITWGPPPLDNTQCSPQLPLILLEAWMHEITQHTEFVFKISRLCSILTINDRNSMYSISMYFNTNKHDRVLGIDSTGLRAGPDSSIWTNWWIWKRSSTNLVQLLLSAQDQILSSQHLIHLANWRYACYIQIKDFYKSKPRWSGLIANVYDRWWFSSRSCLLLVQHFLHCPLKTPSIMSF